MKTNLSDNARKPLAPSSHEHASRLHLDAARHYLIGKDYAHAAHQALVAHGHAMLALAQGREVTNRYLERASANMEPGSDPYSRFDPISLGPSGIVRSSLHVAEHHDAAAELHQHAAQYLLQAAKHYEDGEVALAAHEAQAAHALALCAIDHSNEAARHHAIGCCLADTAATKSVATVAA